MTTLVDDVRKDSFINTVLIIFDVIASEDNSNDAEIGIRYKSKVKRNCLIFTATRRKRPTDISIADFLYKITGIV